MPGGLLAAIWLCATTEPLQTKHFVGTALPFEVASVAAVAERALSGEMLTQLLPPSLCPQLPYLGWLCCLGTGCCPLCRAVCQPRACRAPFAVAGMVAVALPALL